MGEALHVAMEIVGVAATGLVTMLAVFWTYDKASRLIASKRRITEENERLHSTLKRQYDELQSMRSERKLLEQHLAEQRKLIRPPFDRP